MFEQSFFGHRVPDPLILQVRKLSKDTGASRRLGKNKHFRLEVSRVYPTVSRFRLDEAPKQGPFRT